MTVVAASGCPECNSSHTTKTVLAASGLLLGVVYRNKGMEVWLAEYSSVSSLFAYHDAPAVPLIAIWSRGATLQTHWEQSDHHSRGSIGAPSFKVSAVRSLV